MYIAYDLRCLFSFFLSVSRNRFVVMVPDPRLDSSFQDTADRVLGSLLDFNPTGWDLPPFEDKQI